MVERPPLIFLLCAIVGAVVAVCVAVLAAFLPLVGVFAFKFFYYASSLFPFAGFFSLDWRTRLEFFQASPSSLNFCFMVVPISSALPPPQPSLEDIKAKVSDSILALSDSALSDAAEYQKSGVEFFKYCLSVSNKELKRRKLLSHAK